MRRELKFVMGCEEHLRFLLFRNREEFLVEIIVVVSEIDFTLKKSDLRYIISFCYRNMEYIYTISFFQYMFILFNLLTHFLVF